MNEIKLSVDDKNLEKVIFILNNLKTGLVSEITTTSEATVDTYDESDNPKAITEDYSHRSNLHHITEDDKRKKLFSFAFITLILLSIAAVYFEVYDTTHVPPFLRFILAIYWVYSFVGIIVSKLGSDYWVSKLYFNVSK